MITPRLRKHWLLIAAGACVALLAADRVVIGPLSSTWKARSARIKDLAQSIENGRVLLDRRDALQTQWKEIEQQALSNDAPKAESKVLNAVNSWAAESRFTVTAVIPRWVEDETLGPRVEVRVSGTGDLEAVSRFLYALETSSLPLRLEDVEMRARNDTGREIGLDARFSGLTFSPKEEKKS